MLTKSGIAGPGSDRTEIYRTGSQVVLVVRGYHQVQSAHDAIAYLQLIMAEYRGTIEFVADLRNITGFDEDCRRLWQDGLRAHTSRIKLITLVQGTPLAKMAAGALGLYLGIPVKVVDQLKDPDAMEILCVLRGPNS